MLRLDTDLPGRVRQVLERLRDIGIDVERFLRGLLYRFHTAGKPRIELGPWRLARSIREAKLGPTMASQLRVEAARADLDDFNRLRATMTLAYLRVQDGRPERVVGAELAALPLPKHAADWAAAFGRE